MIKTGAEINEKRKQNQSPTRAYRTAQERLLSATRQPGREEGGGGRPPVCAARANVRVSWRGWAGGGTSDVDLLAVSELSGREWVSLTQMTSCGNSQVALVVETCLAVQGRHEVWVSALGGEDLKWERATHPSILAWRISWPEEPRGYSP